MRVFTRRRIIAFVLLVFAGIFFYQAFTVTTTTLPYSRAFAMDWTPHVSGYPSVRLSGVIYFYTEGSFSVNNPINFLVIINRVNISNFLTHYGGVGFTDAGSQFNQLLASGVTIPVTTPSFAPLRQSAEGYHAQGQFTWFSEGDSYLTLAPQEAALYNPIVSFAKFGLPVIKIAGVSDTLSIEANKASLRLTWILVGFSVLMLQPILEALLLKDDCKRG